MCVNNSISNINATFIYPVWTDTITKKHYIAKSIGSPPYNERFDYFSNFHEYKS